MEKELQKAIKDYLQLNGYYVFKGPTGGVYNEKRQTYIPLGQKGIPDLIACSPKGRFVAIEVKMKGNKPTIEQQEFLDEVNKRGGLGIVAYEIHDVMAIL